MCLQTVVQVPSCTPACFVRTCRRLNCPPALCSVALHTSLRAQCLEIVKRVHRVMALTPARLLPGAQPVYQQAPQWAMGAAGQGYGQGSSQGLAARGQVQPLATQQVVAQPVRRPPRSQHKWFRDKRACATSAWARPTSIKSHVTLREMRVVGAKRNTKNKLTISYDVVR